MCEKKLKFKSLCTESVSESLDCRSYDVFGCFSDSRTNHSDQID